MVNFCKSPGHEIKRIDTGISPKILFQHVLERAVILSDDIILKEEDLQLSPKKSSSNGFELETYNLDEVEKTIIEKVLHINRGNISKASSELGLTRTSLYRRMEKYGL